MPITPRRLLLALSCILVGCTSPPTSPDEPISAIAAVQGGGPEPDCIEGCLDPDPNPSAPGLYIAGTAYTGDGCMEYGGDLDYDGLSDECEHQLALHFAPLLSFVYADDVRREPRYAAQWVGSGVVRIAYLLSYWMDNGAPGAPLCMPWFEGCAGHVGDSEYIALDLAFSSATQHWRVVGAALSAHETPYVCSESQSVVVCPLPKIGWKSGNLQFPGHPQAAPLIFVSDGKHANYPSDAACDAGGTYHSDDCSSPRYTDLVQVSQSNNIGSRDHRLIDGVTTSNSTHPVDSSQYIEYYWTSQDFHGWFSPSISATSRPYSTILTELGF